MAMMEHNRLTLSGTNEEQTAGDEIWSCSINGFATLSPAPEVMDMVNSAPGYLATIAPLLASWFVLPAHQMAQGSVLNQVKIAHIGTDGKYVGAPVVQAVGPSAGALGATMPSFCSVAFSWTTPVKTGRRGRNGRIYPPNYAVPLNVGATITTAGATSALAAAKALLTVIANSGGSSGQTFAPCVVGQSYVGFEQITGCRVGNVVDVQRRRKDGVAEIYQASAWP
jgi:hypothetical protein